VALNLLPVACNVLRGGAGVLAPSPRCASSAAPAAEGGEEREEGREGRQPMKDIFSCNVAWQTSQLSQYRGWWKA